MLARSSICICHHHEVEKGCARGLLLCSALGASPRSRADPDGENDLEEARRDTYNPDSLQ